MRLNAWRSRQGKHCFSARMAWQPPVRASRLPFLAGVFSVLAATLLKAQAQPVNDKFAAAKPITGLVGTVAGTTLNATYQPNEPAHAGHEATHSVWYRWSAPDSSVRVEFSTEGSEFDTTLAIYTGKTIDTLTEVASNNDWTVDLRFSKTDFQATPGTTYWIAIDGANQEMGNTVLGWITHPFNDDFVKFKVLAEPQGTFAGNSTGAGLEMKEQPPVAGDVTSTVWFVWAPNDGGEITVDTKGSEFNTVLAVYVGNELEDLTLVTADDDSGGDDGTSKVIFDAQVGNRYRIVVGGRDGATGAYRINWAQQLPPPLNDNLAGAQELLGFAGQTKGANFGATEEPGEPRHGATSSQASVWYTWEADRTGRVCFSLENASAALLLAVYEGEEFPDLTRVAMGEPGPQGQPAMACFDAVRGRRYRFAVDGAAGSPGSFQLQWIFDGLTSPYNQFAQARVLTGFNCSGETENYYADLQPGEPLHAGDSGGKSVWFKWKAPADYRVRLDTAGSNFDTLLAVYTGKDPETGLMRVASNDDADGRTTSQLTFDAEAEETYYFAVDGSTLQDTEPPQFGMIILTLNQAAPQSVLLSPTRGVIGSKVRIGTLNFPDLVSVTIGALECEFKVDGDGILATIPVGAVTGPITLRNSEGNVRVTEGDFTVLPGSLPQLSIRRQQNGSLEIAWPSQYSDFRVQTTTRADGSEDWVDAGVLPAQVGGELVVTMTITEATLARYFRLALP